MKKQTLEFSRFLWRNILLSTVTYILFGILASILLNYRELWSAYMESVGYRSMDSPWIMAGPLLQPLRGLIYAVVLWPIKDKLVSQKYGWLTMSGLLIGIGIIGTFAAAPSSIEGLIYTNHPLRIHLIGLPETCGHALLYSWLLITWEKSGPRAIILTRFFRSIWGMSIGILSYIFLGVLFPGINGAAAETVSITLYIALTISALLTVSMIYWIQGSAIKGYFKLSGLIILSISLPFFIEALMVKTLLNGFISIMFFSIIAGALSGLWLKGLQKRKANS